MLVKDLIAQLLDYPEDASIQIYDECDRFDFNLDYLEDVNILDLNKFESRCLNQQEESFIESCERVGGYNIDDVIGYLLGKKTDYFDGYTQIADAWHFWQDGIKYINSFKA